MNRVARFNALFIYEAKSGRLIYRVARPGPRASQGEAAGAPSHGYLRVSVDGVRYPVHRVIWEMTHGPIPDGKEIDHIDGNRSNNRLNNLRLVTTTENMRNKRIQRNSPTGVLGVNPHGVGFKVTCLGYVGWFHDFFEACCARKSAELTRGFHENHGRSAT